MDQPRLVFLLDIDNTLLDNDQVKVDLDTKLDGLLGKEESSHFWELYEQVRKETEVVDIPATLLLFKEGYTDTDKYAKLQAVFDELDFTHYLYPNSLETLRYLGTIGTTVILTDGDKVFQRAKAVRSGIQAIVEDRVLLYIHKQQHFQEIMETYPADEYVMVDDKPKILSDSQDVLGDRLTTVFVCQGKYSHMPNQRGSHKPSLTVNDVADLLNYTAEEFYTHKFHAQGECAVLEQQTAL